MECIDDGRGGFTLEHNLDAALAEQKQVFSTGEAAKVLKCSQMTVIRRIDNGFFKGFRVPGSRFRKMSREQLIRAARDCAIPTTLERPPVPTNHVIIVVSGLITRLQEDLEEVLRATDEHNRITVRVDRPTMTDGIDISSGTVPIILEQGMAKLTPKSLRREMAAVLDSAPNIAIETASRGRIVDAARAQFGVRAAA